MKPELEKSQLEAEHQTTEIEHVVERESRRLLLRIRVGRAVGEAVVEARGKRRGQRRDDRDVAQTAEMRLDGPARAGYQRRDAEVQQRVQFLENGKAIFTDERRQRVVLEPVMVPSECQRSRSFRRLIAMLRQTRCAGR